MGKKMSNLRYAKKYETGINLGTLVIITLLMYLISEDISYNFSDSQRGTVLLCRPFQGKIISPSMWFCQRYLERKS